MSVVLAVQNADILRALSEPAAGLTIAVLACEVGRDDSNLGKTLKRLREADLVCADALALTPAGVALLPRLDVLDGVTEIPEGFMALPHCALAAHPLNPRKSFDAEALDELRQDILQSGGVTSSLLVRPAHERDFPQGRQASRLGIRYWIVAGERRWRAIGAAIEDGDLPSSYRLPCQVREMSDAEHLRLSISENIQRVDLDHVELGQQFEALLLTGEDTPKTIAERLSKTPEYVQQHVRVLRLGDDDQARLKSGEMTFKAALDMVAKPRPKTEPEPELGFAPQPASPVERAPIVETAAPKTDPSPAEASRTAFAPSPKMALVLIEIADKVLKDPMSRFREGYTRVAEVPAGGAASELVHARAIGFRSIGGQDEVRIDPRGPAQDWFEAQGYYRDDDFARSWRLYDAWIDAGIGGEKAYGLKASNTYASEWLNVAEPVEQNSPAVAQAPAADGRPLPETNAPASPLAKPQSVGPTDEPVAHERVLQEQAERLAISWTGTGWRFPPISPSLPTEQDFRSLLEKTGIALPIEARCAALFDAAGMCFAVLDDDRVDLDQQSALAQLIRIALHVCSGEALRKAAG